MPGYLHHVVSRIAGTAPVLKPRLPSRFEPVRERGSVDASAAFGDLGQEISAGAVEPPVGTIDALPGLGPLATVSDRSRMPLRPRMAPRTADTESSPSVASSIVPGGGVPARPTAPQTGGQVSDRSAVPPGRAKDSIPGEEEAPPATSIPSRQAGSRERQHAEPDQDGTSGQPFTGATLANLDKIARELFARAPGSQASAAHVSPTPERHDRGGARERESRVEPPLAIAPAMTPASKGPVDAQQFEAATPKQDIHIVIGRITVQGSTPPPLAAVPPQARPAPKLTLDQYLQARGNDR